MLWFVGAFFSCQLIRFRSSGDKADKQIFSVSAQSITILQVQGGRHPMELGLDYSDFGGKDSVGLVTEDAG